MEATLVSWIGLLLLFLLASCNPLSEGQEGSVKGANYHPGLSSRSVVMNWGFESSNASDYDFSTNYIEFNNGAARLKSFDQLDDDDSISGFGGSTQSNLTWDFVNGVLRLNQAATPTNTSELNSSWTPQWGNLKGYWKLNETVGTSVADSSGSGYTGTKTGSFTSGNPGKLDKSVTFNGTAGNYIRLPFSMVGLSAITWSVWFKTTAAGGIVGESNQDPGVNPSEFNPFLRVDLDGYFRAGFFNGNPLPYQGLKSKFTVNDGKWHHAVLTRNSSGQSLYLDGIFQASITGGGSHLPKLFIGAGYTKVWARGNETWHYFNGSIDELALWNTILTAEQVSHLYSRQSALFSGSLESRVFDASSNSQSWTSASFKTSLPNLKELPDAGCTPTPPATSCPHINSESSENYSSISNNLMDGIIALWHLNETSGTSAIDDSGNELHGAYVNNPDLAAKGKFGTGVSLERALTQYISTPSINLGDNFTISLWASLNTTSSEWQTLASNSMSGSSANGFRFAVNTWNTSNRSVLLETGNGATSAGVSISGATTYGQWHHYVLVVDRSLGKVKIFLDGKKINVAENCLTNFNVTGPIRFGTTLNSNGRLDGAIDEIGIWNRNLSETEVSKLYLRGGNRVKFQVRTCTAPDCSDDSSGANWKGPDGSNQSYFSELNNNSVPLDGSGEVKKSSPLLLFSNFTNPVGTSRYFQYRTFLESDDEGVSCDYGSGSTWCSPELKSVSIGPDHFDSLAPTIIGKIGFDYKSLSKFETLIGPEGCDEGVLFNLGVGEDSSTASWYWWNGSKWVGANGTKTEANTSSEISNYIQKFSSDVDEGRIYFKAYLSSSGTSACSLDNVRMEGKR